MAPSSPILRLVLRALATRALERKGIVVPPQNPEQPVAKREFLLGGFPVDASGGGIFEFCEMPLHRLVQTLPVAIEALRRGEEVKDEIIYTLGYPTNEYGTVSETLQQTKPDDILKTLSSYYRTLIEHELAQNPPSDEEGRVAITGVSTGASVGAEVASELMQTGIVTQDPQTRLPHLSVTMFSPAGIGRFNESIMRKPQIIAGLVGEAAVQQVVNPGVRVITAAFKPFAQKMQTALADRMMPRTNPEEVRAKSAARMSLAKALLEGGRVPENLKVTEIVGLYDPLLYSTDRAVTSLSRAKQQRTESGEKGPLQGRALPRDAEHERAFVLSMPHLPPFYRDSEWGRYDKLVAAIDALK